jgi:hypothetical protein
MTIDLYKGEQSRGLSADSAFEPQSFEAALNVCRTLVASKMFGNTTPEALLLKVMAGRELGLSVLQSVRSIYTFESQGRLVTGIDAATIVAKVQRHPQVDHFLCVESTEKQATYELAVKGREPSRLTYTIDDARAAGLTEKDVWKKHPKNMLRARAATNLVRRDFPEAIMGWHTVDEVEEIRESYDGRSQPTPHRAHVTVADAQPEPVAAATPANTNATGNGTTDVVTTYRKRLAEAETREELAVLFTEIKGLAKAEKDSLGPDYNAAKKRIHGDGPKPPTGGGAPKPEAPATTDATGSGEHVQAEGEGAKASAAQILDGWADHLAPHESPQHVLNSVAAHLTDFDPSLRTKVMEIAAPRLRAFKSMEGKDCDKLVREACAKKSEAA